MDAVSSASATTTAPAAGSPPRGSIGTDFRTFLTMLTVQMRNQDPLNPIDSADYAVQIATFSGVEQQALTNQLLGGIAGSLGTLGLAGMAGWIGQEARVAADVLRDGPGSIPLFSEAVAGADSAVLVVRDERGDLVAREPVLPAGGRLEWFGADATGAPLPPGRYALSVEGSRDGEMIGTAPVEHYARIAEVRAGNPEPLVVLDGGIEVAAGAVRALRQGPPPPR